LNLPFSLRGGHYGYTSRSGITTFYRTNGFPDYTIGFRTTLVAR